MGDKLTNLGFNNQILVFHNQILYESIIQFEVQLNSKDRSQLKK